MRMAFVSVLVLKACREVLEVSEIMMLLRTRDTARYGFLLFVSGLCLGPWVFQASFSWCSSISFNGHLFFIA